MSIDKLKEAIWNAAGWGQTICSCCGSEMQRILGLGSSSTSCSSSSCRDEQDKEAKAYWQDDESET